MTCVCFRSRNSQSGTTHLSFTGQDQDTTSGLYDFLLRKYDAGQSRWTSPDPAGLSATSAAFPQSWNRYAYALNNPLVYRDPQGLFCVYLDDSGEKIEALDDNSDSGECGSNGGYRIPGEYGGASQISIDPDLGIVSGYGYLDGSWQYSVAGAMDSNTWGAWTQTADAPQQGSFGGNGSWGIWDTIRSMLPPLSLNVSWLAGPIIPGALHWGSTYQFTWIPQSNTKCVSAGLAVGTPGKAANFGPLILGNVNSAKAILQGFSWGGNVQTTGATGGQDIRNLSGDVGGPTWGTPGASFSATYGACFGGKP